MTLPDRLGPELAAALGTLVDVLADRVAERLRGSAPQARPLLSKQDLSVQLGVSVASVDRLCREGRLPFVLVGETRRFDLEEVRAALPRGEPGPGTAKVRDEIPVRYGRRRAR